MPANNSFEEKIQAALVLELDSPQVAVEMDEVVGQVALVMKPLAAHLCRPGITSAAFDGNGNVLLVVNLPEMIRLKGIRQYAEEMANEAGTASKHDLPSPQSTTPLRRTILIADDSVSIRQSIITTLNHEGYDVKEAVDGLQTLEQLSKETLDLLLLDVEMPNLNGYEAARRIRAEPWGEDIMLVALTGWGQPGDKQRAAAAGFDHHCVKPVEFSFLRNLLSLAAAKRHA